MSRIDLTDTGMDVLVKMSEGNPGALQALMDIMAKHDSIDPQAAMGGLGAVMLLDTWKIYGSGIYILYNDKCGRDVRKMLMLLRAVQMGMLRSGKLQEMAADEMRAVDLPVEEWQKLDDQVCERLEDFAKAA